MAKLFTAADIQYSRIPEAGAHEAAAQEFLDGTRELADTCLRQGVSVKGALIYGSVADQHRIPNMRSDVDCFLSYDGDPAVVLPTLSALDAGISSRHRLPLEVNAVAMQDYANGSSGSACDILYIDHLQAVARSLRLQWGNPVSGLNGVSRYPPEEQLPEAIRAVNNYLTAKQNNFFRSLGNPATAEGDLKVLQRALEIPTSIGRKIMTLMEIERCLEAGSAYSGFVSPPHVSRLDRWHEVYGHDTRLTRSGYKLSQFDQEYDFVLLQTLNGEASLVEYTGWFKAIRTEALNHALTSVIAAKNIVKAAFGDAQCLQK